MFKWLNIYAAGRQPALFQAAKGDWRLTTTERKRILLNNIFGVDIDPQAVEVTKLSLLLKVLEGENAQTISQQLKFFHERALPDLGNNIKCGNSLIGPDFYEQQMNLIYVVFVEKGLSLLNKNGRLGFILPHKFFNAKYGEPLRSIIAKGKYLSHVVHFGDQQIFVGGKACHIYLD
jgi:hypothetical protein